MGANLGASLDEFRELWEKNYIANKGNCEHHDSRFKEGWIPLALVPFSSALGRDRGEEKLAIEIVKALGDNGKYVFREHGRRGITEVERALKEVMFEIPKDIELLIADYTSDPLMLDRMAFTTEGHLIDNHIQWYLSRKTN